NDMPSMLKLTMLWRDLSPGAPPYVSVPRPEITAQSDEALGHEKDDENENRPIYQGPVHVQGPGKLRDKQKQRGSDEGTVEATLPSHHHIQDAVDRGGHREYVPGVRCRRQCLL